MVDFQGEWSVKSVSKRRTFITLFPSITLVPRVELCLWRKTLFLPLFFTLLKKFFLGCAFTGGHKDLMELGDCFYNLTVFFSLQCCAHHMNLCTSRESLLWRDFVRMTWNFWRATKWLYSSSTWNLSSFGSVVLEKSPKKPPIFHLFKKPQKIGGFLGFSPKLLNQMSSNFVWS